MRVPLGLSSSEQCTLASKLGFSQASPRKDHRQSLLLKAALIGALTTAGQPGVTHTGSPQHSVMHLDGSRIGGQTALPRAYIRTMSIMFKITQNTIRQFTLAEILLMAAMNEINAKQRTLERSGQARRDPMGIGQ